MIDTDRKKALDLLQQFVKNQNLINHMLSVEAAMKYYAEKFGEDSLWWGNIGLLHDFDYEKYPSPEDHPTRGAKILQSAGYSPEFVTTIMAHAPHTGIIRNTLAKKAIFAVDELAGFIVAVALIKPNKKLAEVTVKSIKKKMKNKSFARQVNRREIIEGADELNLSLEVHISNVLIATQKISMTLNL